MVSQILVVGGECAGLLAALNLRAKLPQLRVRVLRHPVADFQPPGQATTVEFPHHLHGELGIPQLEFLKAVRPIWRNGTRYQWGPRAFFDHTCEFQVDTRYGMLSRETGYYIGDGPREFEAIGSASANISAGKIFFRDKDGRPLIAEKRYGYHLETSRLKEFLENAARQRGVEFVEGEVIEVLRGEAGVAGVRIDDGQVLEADLYVDASGFEPVLLGPALKMSYRSFAPGLACDSAIVGSWPRTTESIQPHTSVRAMDSGWCWQSEHESFIACGYAFSSAHVEAEDAQRQLKALYPSVTSLRFLKLPQGRYENSWEDNVIAIGSAAGCLEPLAAAGPGVLAFACQGLAQSLVDCDGVVRPTIRKQFNKRWRRLVETERDFLGLFYKYNSSLDTPFWRDARAAAHVGRLQEVIQCYQQVGPDSIHRSLLLAENDPINLEGYFSVMLGLNVPHRPWTAPAGEIENWKKIQDSWRRRAASSFTVAEALRYFDSSPAMAKVGAMA